MKISWVKKEKRRTVHHLIRLMSVMDLDHLHSGKRSTATKQSFTHFVVGLKQLQMGWGVHCHTLSCPAFAAVIY